ncbi:MAG: hypothetical protein V4538_15205 [Bacteroidota bacterium]
MAEEPKNINTGEDPLKSFQLAELSTKQKESPDFGLKISKKIWGYTTTSLGGYFYNRNAQYVINRNYANGIMDVRTMFQDRFQFNAKQNFIRLDWQTLQIVNRIISGLVGRWMQRGEKIEVTATDDRSQKNKEEQYAQLEFIIENLDQLQKLQDATGVAFVPKDDLPADKDELKLWKAQFQRLPEEIENELGCNDVLQSNGMYDVVKEKLLHDSAEVGFVGTYTWMDEQGVIHSKWVKPEDAIYGWSEYPDFRDASWLGEAPSMKISELRRDFGKEFHPNDPLALTEEQLFKIAQTAKEWSFNTNLVWNNLWNSVYLRPYDEWNVRSLKFELRTVDSEPYTVTNSTISDRTYVQKGMPVNKKGEPKSAPSPNQKVIDDSNINIYESVYLPDNDILLRWKLKENMIRPQDPKEIGNAEYSYSFYMYQNYLMRNLAVPQKIQAAVDGMILALLKVQQDVSLAIPPGWVFDETALQNIDYGLGNEGNKSVDHARLFLQTGKLYYKGIDAEGNRVPPPIEEIANTGFAQHIEAFIRTYEFWYKTLRDELGEDPNLISSAVQPRVTAGNVESSLSMQEYATDYMYRAYAECMKMTARKVSCLLKDSIVYGSKAYRNIIKGEYTTWQIFNTDIKFLPTDQQVSQFDMIIQNAINSTPELALFLNQLQAMEMVKQDVKLGWTYYNSCIKKMILWKQKTTAENTQATGQIQIASAQAAEKAKQETETVKIDGDLAKVKMEGDTSTKNALSVMFTSFYKDGGQVPPEMKPAFNAWVENIMLPMISQNEEQKATIMQQMKEAQQKPDEQGEQLPDNEQEQIQPQQQEQIAA